MGSQKSRERLRCGLSTGRTTSRSIHTSIPLRPRGFYTQTCFLSVLGGGLNVSTVTVTYASFLLGPSSVSPSEAGHMCTYTDTQEMWVQSLGQEDPPEDNMATYSSILAWEIPWTEEPGRL